MISFNKLIENLEGKKIPPTHPAHENSFIFLNSAGMRLDPEDFILEIYRELFYESRYEGDGKGKKLDPEALETREEKLLLYAFAGRRSKYGTKESYTPVYPLLAKYAYFRKEAERTIKNFLFSGPIAQHLENSQFQTSKEEQAKQFCLSAYKALTGNNSCTDIKFQKDKELLSCLAIHGDSQKILPEKLVVDKLMGMITYSKSTFRLNRKETKSDELSARIYEDMSNLFELEKEIARIEWIELFKTYLRIALPVWMLAQARILIYVHKIIFDPSEDPNSLISNISKRNQRLFHPSTAPNSGGREIIEEYTRRKIELDILLHFYSELDSEYFHRNSETKHFVLDDSPSTQISLMDFVRQIRQKETAICSTLSTSNSVSLHQAIMRLSEHFDAWRNPTRISIGKNMDEMLRVLRATDTGTDGALLKGYKEGNKLNGFIVFPGPNLIRLFAVLVKAKNGHKKILLEDLESHFRQYGVDFSESDEARKKLIFELLKLGLLKGSPDAGKSAQIISPF